MNNVKKNLNKKIFNFIINNKILFLLIVAILALGIRDISFIKPDNIIHILNQLAINGIMAAGMTVLLTSGMFDLSVGSVLAFSGVVAVTLQPLGLFLSITGGLLAGTAVGMINGLLVVKGKINTFIATMGTMIIFRGLSLGITYSDTIRSKIDNFQILGQGSFLNIPYRTIILIIVYFVVWYILKYTKFGRYSFSIGGDINLAKLAGINTDLYLFSYFVFCSFLASISGLILSSSVNAASGYYGVGIEIWIIASVVLGGTSLSGGKGTIMGTFQGVLLLGIIYRAMIVLNIDTNYQSLFRGLVIILVVIIDAVFSNKKLLNLQQ